MNWNNYILECGVNLDGIGVIWVELIDYNYDKNNDIDGQLEELKEEGLRQLESKVIKVFNRAPIDLRDKVFSNVKVNENETSIVSYHEFVFSNNNKHLLEQ